MDPRHTDAEDEQFLLNMIGEGQGDVPEQADDDSNTDIYLNMSGDGIEALFGSKLFSEVPFTSKGILLFYSIK